MLTISTRVARVEPKDMPTSEQLVGFPDSCTIDFAAQRFDEDPNLRAVGGMNARPVGSHFHSRVDSARPHFKVDADVGAPSVLLF